MEGANGGISSSVVAEDPCSGLCFGISSTRSLSANMLDNDNVRRDRGTGSVSASVSPRSNSSSRGDVCTPLETKEIGPPGKTLAIVSVWLRFSNRGDVCTPNETRDRGSLGDVCVPSEMRDAGSFGAISATVSIWLKSSD